MARTLILEHRPVSMVAKAIDVLVTSYSHSVKTGSFLKGLKTGNASPSGVPNVGSPRSGIDASINRDEFGISIKLKSTSVVDSEPVNRSLTFSTSESEDNAGFVPPKTNLRDLQIIGVKLDKEHLMGAESSRTDVQSLSLLHQLPGPSNIPLHANVSKLHESQITSPAISPDELYRSVFAPVEEEMVGDPSYLIAIIVEFLHSACLEKVKVHPNLYVLVIQLLARNERYAELGSFVINKILEPSKEVALQLLESGRQNFQTRKLGLHMLRQLSLHEDYVLLLVQEGYYQEALRYARKHKVTTVRPSLFLELAFASNDSQHLAAVLRFFSDFLPGFRSTPEHNTYIRLLNEMSSSFSALTL